MKQIKIFAQHGKTAFLMSALAMSSAAHSIVLEEIIVTAQKREQNLQDTPISITALTGQQLRDAAIADVTDVESLTPNLTFTPGTGGGSSTVNAFIRGVGEFDFLLTKDPAVGLYMDGVYIARTFGANMELADIERIEILRGPQGTLFGKNSIGGAINVVTKTPGDNFKYSIAASAGSYGFRGFNAYIEGPLSDNLSASASVIGKWSDGWQSRPGGDAGDDDVKAGRVRLNWSPSENFSSQFSFDGVHQRQNGYPNAMLAWNDSAFFAFLQNLLLDPCCTATTDIDKSGAASAELLHDDLDGFGVNWTNTWSLNPFTVKSITAYREMDALFGRDGDNSALNYAGDVHDESHHQFSQEFQLTGLALDDRLNWTAGLYYFTEDTQDDTTLIVAEGLYDALTALPSPLLFAGENIALDLNVDFDNHQESTSYAAFFHTTYRITDQLNLNLGARYTEEKKDFEQNATRIASGAPLIFPDATVTNPYATPGKSCSDIALDGSFQCEETWSEFSPKIGLDFSFNESLMLYGQVSRGFRSGGFNGRPTAIGEISEYDPETLTSYELGFKSQWLDNRLQLNGDIFLNKYEDQQVVIIKASATGISATTQNAGRSTIKGVELELRAKPVAALDLSAGLSYLDAQYDEWSDDLGDYTDREFQYAPKWTANVAAQYSWQLGEDSRLILRGDGVYKDETYLDATNTSYLRQGGYAVWNASLRYQFNDDRWEVGIAGKNLGDKRVLIGGFSALDSFGFVEGSYNAPRRVLLTARYSFM